MLMYFLLIFTLVILFVSFSSTSMLVNWCLLEFILLILCLLIVISPSQSAKLSFLKYFILQSATGLLILLSIFSQHMNSLGLFSIILKLGLAPFHFWVVDLFYSFDLMCLLFVSTVSNVPSLVLLDMFIFLNSDAVLPYLYFISVVSLLLASVLAFGWSKLNTLLAYSSVYGTYFYFSVPLASWIWHFG